MAIEVDRRAFSRYAIGDVTAIVLFVILGEISHGANPLAILGPMLQTLATFLFGWFAVGIVGGAYVTETRTDRRQAVVVPLILWALADVIAQALRATSTFPGNASVTFYLVALIFGGALLGGWRYLAFRIADTEQSRVTER